MIQGATLIRHPPIQILYKLKYIFSKVKVLLPASAKCCSPPLSPEAEVLGALGQQLQGSTSGTGGRNPQGEACLEKHLEDTIKMCIIFYSSTKQTHLLKIINKL